MLTKFIEGLGSKLAEQWVIALLTPAFVFWAGGFGIWVYLYGWGRFIQRFAALSPPTKILVPVVGLIVVTVSALVVRRLEAPVLRLLEGYWPRVRPVKWLRRKLVGRKTDRIESMKNQWGALKVKEASGSLTPEETEELRDLEWKLHYVPSTPEQYMPTKLGNILRAAELRPSIQYGLDVIVCWPPIWMLLPAEIKKDLTDARADLDAGVRVLLWGCLFLTWSALARSWWMPLVIIGLSISAITFSYFHMVVGAAEIYGSLLESAFNLYRPALYQALRWPSPSKPAEEKTIGDALTMYLWRGLYQDDQEFTAAEPKPPSPPSPTTIIVEAPEVMRELRRIVNRK